MNLIDLNHKGLGPLGVTFMRGALVGFQSLYVRGDGTLYEVLVANDEPSAQRVLILDDGVFDDSEGAMRRRLAGT